MYLNGIPLDQNPGGTPKMRADIKSFVHAMENELLDCDADIARVEDLLRRLKQERQAAESFVAQHKCILSRVHALPPEITVEIFRYCLDEGLPPLNRPRYAVLHPKPGALPMPWILSAVCRRWRNIIKETPSYWSSLNVAGEDLSDQLLDQALQFSRDAPLHFALDLQLSDTHFLSLLEHATRWRSVDISGSRKSFVDLDELGELPILKKLCVTLNGHWNDTGRFETSFESSIDITTALLPFSDCPQLKELFISTGEQYRPSHLETPSLSIPWANLFMLTVVLGVYSSHAVRSLLSVCANLRQLNVSGMGLRKSDDPILPEPLLIHSSITSLSLYNSLDLIHQTEYPALSRLSMWQTTPQEIIPFLSLHHHVSHSELSAHSETMPGRWDPVLRLLPDVTHFTVHLVMAPSPLWTTLNKSLVASLPNLRKLTIDVKYHLLKFCEHMDIIPLVASRWSNRTLQILEIFSTRAKDWRWADSERPALHTVATGDLPGAVSRIIEESDTIKALQVLKEEGLEVMINGIR